MTTRNGDVAAAILRFGSGRLLSSSAGLSYGRREFERERVRVAHRDHSGSAPAWGVMPRDNRALCAMARSKAARTIRRDGLPPLAMVTVEELRKPGRLSAVGCSSSPSCLIGKQSAPAARYASRETATVAKSSPRATATASRTIVVTRGSLALGASWMRSPSGSLSQVLFDGRPIPGPSRHPWQAGRVST